MKKYKISDIAAMAEVSVGTVDRVLHERGEVSPETRKRIEAVLERIHYVKRIHSKSVSCHKTVRLLVIIPQYHKGDYWDRVREGIERAMTHFVQCTFQTTYLTYNQFDINSCKNTFRTAASYKKDAVIIGPTFSDETFIFASQLSLQRVKYIFVDALVRNAEPLTAFVPDNVQCGKAQARLLTAIMDHSKKVLLLQSKRVGDDTSIASFERQRGFISYLAENAPDIEYVYGVYDCKPSRNTLDELDGLFTAYPVGAVAVFNSQAHLLVHQLKTLGRLAVPVCGYGTNARNVQLLKDGSISFLIEEHPEYQGYMAVKAIADNLMSGSSPRLVNYAPIDIMLKETVDYFLHSDPTVSLK